MINNWILISISVAYWLLLFVVAYLAERHAKRGKGLSHNPYIYSLSLAVFCTAWTFFGSVGKVKDGGFDFLAVYIGPTLFMPLGWIVLRKVIRICKVQRITTIADFISSRYGKNVTLASIVTIFCFFGIIPYISLQLKAISESYDILTHGSLYHASTKGSFFFFEDTAFMMAIGMALFAVIFGTRKIEATERHEGMVTAIAFESIIKLLAFLAVGIYVTFMVYDGFGDIFTQALASPHLKKLFVVPEGNGFSNWFWISFLSGMAVFFLPRQFQVAVVENVDEKHLNKAIWLFPLYLLAINIFVLPIAFSGQMIFGEVGIDADYYILDIPLQFNQEALALFVFVGGYAAATSMIIVETIALSTMFSNHLVLPLLLAIPKLNLLFQGNFSKVIIHSRRLGIVIILSTSYFYYHLLSKNYSLVSIGLISFVSVAQLMPAIIGGIFWKKGNKLGALMGLLAGFVIWFYTLVVPSLAQSFPILLELANNGMFGFDSWSPIVHSLFWSLLVNVTLYVGFSLFTRQEVADANQAELFVNIHKYANLLESTPIWKGTANVPDIRSLLANFLGIERTNLALSAFAQRNSIKLDENRADPKLVAYAERVLSGIIGSGSARIMVSSTVKEEEIKIDEVLDILKESQYFVRLNKELKRKTEELERAQGELLEANNRLLDQDELKDDFLTTVTHELRTPITSIRAFSEILHDNDDIEEEERKHYLMIIIKETERISRLITQVLDLEKYDSGKQKLDAEIIDFSDLLKDCLASVEQLIRDKQIEVNYIEPSVPLLVYGDRDKLQQVIINLFSNAIKFTKDVIAVKWQVREHDFVVDICDNGEGVGEGMEGLIFEKFYQVKNQTIKKPKGSGLGLAISRRIVELHNGELLLEESSHLGATFRLILPLHEKTLPINTD